MTAVAARPAADGGHDRRPPAIFLMGPTAAGKTGLAMALAERFPLGLVSADSAQVYRRLDIGSAKPDAATLARHPHALIDIREPHEPFSAGDFRDEGLAAMARIQAAGRIPLVVGGTGLYFRALERGLGNLPAANDELRAELQAQALAEGWPAMHARLAVVDPAAAARIRVGDRQRILRALEVWHLTGRPISELQQVGGDRRLPWRLLKLLLLPGNRAVLHARIQTRFQMMLEAGFLDEVKQLRSDSRLRPDLPALRAVGYRQAWQFLDEGGDDLERLRQRAVAATRQLAKRQLTWLRGEHDAFSLDPLRSGLIDEAVARIAAFLGTQHR